MCVLCGQQTSSQTSKPDIKAAIILGRILERPEVLQVGYWRDQEVQGNYWIDRGVQVSAPICTCVSVHQATGNKKFQSQLTCRLSILASN